MTEREEAVLHFQWLKKILCEEFQKAIPKDSVAYLASKREERYYDMAISALTEELSEDGTLTVHASDGSKVKRVFVMGDNIFGGLYYPDSAEDKGDLISRQAVINAIANTCFWLSADNWEELTECINSIPSVENKENDTWN